MMHIVERRVGRQHLMQHALRLKCHNHAAAACHARQRQRERANVRAHIECRVSGTHQLRR